MIQTIVTIDPSQLLLLRARLDPKQLDRAVYQAVTRTANTGANIIQREVKKELLLDQQYLKGEIRVRTAGTGIDTEGHIFIADSAVPLIAFQDRQTARGVSVKISRGRPAVLFRHAFFAQVGGHRGIFARAEGRDSSGTKVTRDVFRHLKATKYHGGKLNERGYARRLPIEELYGPSIVDAIGTERLTVLGDRIMLKIRETFGRNLQSQIDRFTKRRGV